MTNEPCSEAGKSPDNTPKRSTSSSGGSANEAPQESCLIENYEGPESECPWQTGEECFDWWMNHAGE